MRQPDTDIYNTVEFAAQYTYLLKQVVYILALPDYDELFNRRILISFNAKLAGRAGIVVETKTARELIQLYSLYSFSDKLIIGSLDLPYGRKLRNLLESGIATEDELINDVILGSM